MFVRHCNFCMIFYQESIRNHSTRAGCDGFQPSTSVVYCDSSQVSCVLQACGNIHWQCLKLLEQFPAILTHAKTVPLTGFPGSQQLINSPQQPLNRTRSRITMSRSSAADVHGIHQLSILMPSDCSRGPFAMSLWDGIKWHTLGGIPSVISFFLSYPAVTGHDLYWS